MMENTPKLDACDLRILAALQQDAGMPRKRIAALCHVSEATCSRRIAELKKRGVIAAQTVRLDARKLGLGLTVFVLVALEKEQADTSARFVRSLRALPSVLAISLISGEYDYLLHMVCTDMEQYHALTDRYLVADRQVKKYVSLFEMKSLKQGAGLPLDRKD